MIVYAIYFVSYYALSNSPPTYTPMSERTYTTYEECEKTADKMQDAYSKNNNLPGYYKCMPFEQREVLEAK